MKIAQIRFENSVDISSLTLGADVTITVGEASVEGGKVMAVADMENPPTLEGDYHISKIIPPEE